HVYNSLMSGRPYFYQMIDDVQIAGRFAEVKLGARVTGVAAPGNAYTVAAAASEVMPTVKPVRQADATFLEWADLLDKKEESWPIWFLVPGGAYLQQKN